MASPNQFPESEKKSPILKDESNKRIPELVIASNRHLESFNLSSFYPSISPERDGVHPSKPLPSPFPGLEKKSLIWKDESGNNIFQAVDRLTGTIYGLMEFSRHYERSEQVEIRREIEIMQKLNHPNLVKLVELFIIGDRIYVLLECMDRGSVLYTSITDEADLAYVAREVLCGLDYLHEYGISHGNIKTSNILVNYLNQVKILYLGKILSTTPVLDVGIWRIYEKFSWDLWNVGLSILKLYEEVFCRKQDVKNLKSTVNVLPPLQKSSSDDFWNFLYCCMRSDVSKRMTAGELLRHSFIEQSSKILLKQKRKLSSEDLSLSYASDITLAYGGDEQNSPKVKKPKFSSEDKKTMYSIGSEKNSYQTPTPLNFDIDSYVDFDSEDFDEFFEDVEFDSEDYDRCCQHCSLFPQDFEFEKDKLVQLWIAEGCINEEVSERIEDVAELYFNRLVNEKVIIPSKIDTLYGQMIYKVNALVDSSRFLTRGDYLRIDDSHLSEIQVASLHLSLQCKKFDQKIFDALKKFKKLRTLLLLGGGGSPTKQLRNDSFLGFKLLRTLDLSSTRISELPGSIGLLESLRCLDLSETLIKLLPDSIDRLSFLQTLRLKGCVEVHALPKDLRKLINLRHLDFDIVSQLMSMPKGMRSLVKLHTLKAFIVGKNDGCGIGELKNLNNITGSFCILKLGNVLNANEAKEAAIGNKKHISKLELRWHDYGNVNSHIETEMLESLQPHFGLKELQIVFYRGSKLPSWISNPSFTDLASITLHECINCDILPSIGELPSLKFLEMNHMNSVKDINSLFCRNHGTQGSNAFPRLEKLIIDNMLNLEKWSGLEEGDFPCLSHVSIRYCPKLSILPVLSRLHTLLYLEISHCMQLISLPEGGMPSSLESLIIRECPIISEQCLKDGEQDWFKKSHLRDIWIDFKRISLN